MRSGVPLLPEPLPAPLFDCVTRRRQNRNCVPLDFQLLTATFFHPGRLPAQIHSSCHFLDCQDRCHRCQSRHAEKGRCRYHPGNVRAGGTDRMTCTTRQRSWRNFFRAANSMRLVMSPLLRVFPVSEIVFIYHRG